MLRPVFSSLVKSLFYIFLICAPFVARADGPQYGLAMYGTPALPPDFTALPYVNPNAPKGGEFVMGEVSGFDSLNPYILKGSAPAQISAWTGETLMARSLDEPFTLYGLLAHSVMTDDRRSYVEFTLRPEARFSDGSPVTPDDVIWSLQILGTQGHPKYHSSWKKVKDAAVTGPYSVRFTFHAPDRELPLLLALRPILKKAQWQGRDITASTDLIIGSGPYIIEKYEFGRFITFRKNPNWWGRDLPVNQGLYNFDRIRIEYYAFENALFEAFKSGLLSTYRETNPRKWLDNYNFPAVQAGSILKAEISHQRPSGIEGLAFNTRRPLFADPRVRDALIYAFNFEHINRIINAGLEPRITSYFGNSALAMGEIPSPAVQQLLAPYELPPDALNPYHLPVSDGTLANRKNMRIASYLLDQAGWHIGSDGLRHNAQGQNFSFEILLPQGQDRMIAAANIYVQSLHHLGIMAQVKTVDSAQYQARTNEYDFDMTHYIRALSLSPGNEQRLYWGAENADTPGSRNWPGIQSMAIDGMISRLTGTHTSDDFTHNVQALDRLLTAGRYVIAVWYGKTSRIAYQARFDFPKTPTLYGDWPGFQPETWWQK